MSVILQVALGGAIGALLRFAGVLAIGRWSGGAFPWGTLGVNICGSFLIGVAAAVFLLKPGLQHLGPFLVTGVLGGFTTFSAFSLEMFQLLERGRTLAAAGYAAGSVMLGLVAVVAGISLVRGWSGA
jgi:CrcB protein